MGSPWVGLWPSLAPSLYLSRLPCSLVLPPPLAPCGPIGTPRACAAQPAAVQDGATALYIACQNGHAEVVRALLMEGGADASLALQVCSCKGARARIYVCLCIFVPEFVRTQARMHGVCT